MTGEKRPDEAENPGPTPGDATSGDATSGVRAEGSGGESLSFDPWAPKPQQDATPRPDTAAATDEQATDGQATPQSSTTPDADILAPQPAIGAAAQPEPMPRPAAQPQPQSDQGRTAKTSGGFSSKALTLVVAAIAGAGLVLWGGPKVAPMLPAPIAGWLTPAGAGVDMAQVEAAIAARLAAQAAPDTADADARAQAQGARAAADSLAVEVATLQGLVQALEARLAAAESSPSGDAADGALIARIEALEVAGGGGDGTALRADIDAIEGALAALAARMNQTPDAGRLSDLESRLGDSVDLVERLAAVEAALADEAAAREGALSAAERARLNAQLSQELARIDRAMIFGEPFADALQTAAAAASVAPPQALADAASNGAPTREALKASFPDAAYNAISAALAAEADQDEGMVASVLARLEARFTGLPGEPIAGDSVPAVLSRARDALLKGDIDSALAGIEVLPAPAREAMAPWTERARLRSEADMALKNWRAELGRTD